MVIFPIISRFRGMRGGEKLLHGIGNRVGYNLISEETRGTLIAIYPPRKRVSLLHPMFLPMVAALLVGFAGSLRAQQAATVRVYQSNPADEDWGFLSDPSKRTDFLDPLKYIRLGAEGRYLTLSPTLTTGLTIQENSGRANPQVIWNQRAQ
jgi:hypothetical protein